MPKVYYSPEEKQRMYDDRRTVRPHFTPKQAEAALAYLNAQAETEPLGTTLRYFIRELQAAALGGHSD